MFVSRLSAGEARRCVRETADLRPGLRAGRLDVHPDHVFVLTCATDAASLSSAAQSKSDRTCLPEQSALIVRQMNADPGLVAEFLSGEGTNIRHLVIGIGYLLLARTQPQGSLHPGQYTCAIIGRLFETFMLPCARWSETGPEAYSPARAHDVQSFHPISDGNPN